MIRHVFWLLSLSTHSLWAADIEFKQTSTPFSMNWIIVVSSLLLIAMTLLVLKQKKWKTHSDEKKLTIIEQHRLNAKTSIYLIQGENHSVLLADNGSHLCFHPLEQKSL